ncbi:MAG: hypothetical protein AB2697_14510 [Candidatus Thiodiazotropha endolucinida]
MRIKEFTSSGAGNARGVRVDEFGNLDREYSTTTLSPEVKTAFKHCVVCGGRFVPIRVNHSLCGQCFSYHRVGRTTENQDLRSIVVGLLNKIDGALL